ncbi:MAG: cell shape-determining protein MreC [Proteobacteria bacterium]|nr:cell shape-determining protein MreC [Pseudomonadota bacterium]
MAIALMVADQRQQYLTVVRAWLSVAAYPFHWAVDAPFSALRYASDALATRSTLQEENERLAVENRELKLTLMRFDALEQENHRLREARAGSARVAARSIVAEILKVDLDPNRQRVIVNKGTRDGVFVGQAALDASGVFGQVTRAGPVSAEVILISDPEHAIPVQINRTGARTIAVGLGQTGQLLLPYLPRNADIAEGDLVVSSGLGGVFPPGYPVARVAEVHRDPSEPLLSVGAIPLAQLDRDPEVMLIWFDNRIVEPDAGAAPEGAPPAAPDAGGGTLAPAESRAAAEPAPATPTTPAAAGPSPAAAGPDGPDTPQADPAAAGPPGPDATQAAPPAGPQRPDVTQAAPPAGPVQ